MKAHVAATRVKLKVMMTKVKKASAAKASAAVLSKLSYCSLYPESPGFPGLSFLG